MSIFDSYEVIRIISLPKRADRRRAMDRQLRQVGLEGDSRVRYFDAIRPADPGPFANVGTHGCFLSHLGVLEEARGKRILILEDDCDFTEAAGRLSAPPEADIFYGGHYRQHPDDPSRDEVVGAHCIGFSPKAAALAVDYLRTFLTAEFVPEPRAVREKAFDGQIRPPVDGAYVWLRRVYPELKVAFAEPVAAIQRPSRTDIAEHGVFDRVPLLSTIANVVRRWK